MDILGLKNYVPDINKGYRCVLVVIHNFSKIGRTVPLKIKNAQTKRDFLGSILISSKKKPKLIETVRGKEIYNTIFRNSLYNKSIEHPSRNTSLGVVFGEGFNQTIRDLFKRPVFEKGDSNWLDVLATITEQYNSRIHLSAKITPMQASFKKNEGFV